MSAGDLIGLFDGSLGAAGVLVIWLALLVSGQLFTRSTVNDKDRQIADLKHALDLERQRGDIQVQTSHVVQELVQGLRKELLP
jgi:HAMP domain-containing protein